VHDGGATCVPSLFPDAFSFLLRSIDRNNAGDLGDDLMAGSVALPCNVHTLRRSLDMTSQDRQRHVEA
jgi:hypothetical protein